MPDAGWSPRAVLQCKCIICRRKLLRGKWDPLLHSLKTWLFLSTKAVLELWETSVAEQLRGLSMWTTGTNNVAASVLTNNAAESSHSIRTSPREVLHFNIVSRYSAVVKPAVFQKSSTKYWCKIYWEELQDSYIVWCSCDPALKDLFIQCKVELRL